MKRLDELGSIAARQLGGLQADEKLYLKIRLAASEQNAARRKPVWKPVLAACAAVVIVAGAVAALVSPEGQELPIRRETVIDSRSAGMEPTAAPVQADGLPQDSLTMSAGVSDLGATLFVAASDGSFPLVMVNGETYRLLRTPEQVDESLLGENLGAVTEFNVEPVLSSGSIVSNAVSVGETVYAISGMKGALLAAPMSGKLRLFQRVSYGGKAIIGQQTLRDTLCDPVDVSWLELDGKQATGDDAQMLMQTLLDGADYQNTAMTGKGNLQIGLKNGLTLQLLVNDDSVSACGTWSCPDFMEAFQTLN